MIAIKVGRIMLLFFVSSWRIIHFGIKPVRGGRPPIDSKMVTIMVVIRGILFHECDRDRVVVVEVVISNMNIVRVIIM